jgi:hypothetical protein
MSQIDEIKALVAFCKQEKVLFARAGSIEVRLMPEGLLNMDMGELEDEKVDINDILFHSVDTLVKPNK